MSDMNVKPIEQIRQSMGVEIEQSPSEHALNSNPASKNSMHTAGKAAKQIWFNLLCMLGGFGLDTVTVESVMGTQERQQLAEWRKLGALTLHEIVETDYEETVPMVEHLLSPGETALLIARQKEGKSTLALQLAVDIASGDAFLGQYKTQRTRVLYVDYENRLHRLKERALDIASGRRTDNIVVKAFPNIADRDVALFGPSFSQLLKLVNEIKPGLLIIDPLRLAIEKDSSDERGAVDVLHKCAALRVENPNMAVLLLHHLKKAQENPPTNLKEDPRAWIERVYGSQALLAHVETIWGLEHDGDGYAFGTVSRSEDSFVVGLEKEPDSERFKLSEQPLQLTMLTQTLQDAWNKLPPEFSRTEGLKRGIPNNTLDRLIRRTRSMGLLTQDKHTKRYSKQISQNVGFVGNEQKQ